MVCLVSCLNGGLNHFERVAFEDLITIEAEDGPAEHLRGIVLGHVFDVALASDVTAAGPDAAFNFDGEHELFVGEVEPPVAFGMKTDFPVEGREVLAFEMFSEEGFGGVEALAHFTVPG